MPREGADRDAAAVDFLAADETAPFIIRNPEASEPVVLVCDHASRRIPAVLGNMGLDPAALRCHLALDIGAGALTEAIAEKLGATAVLCQYSRLVVDCNRQLMDPGAFLEYGDGVVVPGNRGLRQSDKDARANAIYWPYHNAIESQITRFRSRGITPLIVSIHSFTPVMNGESRTWEMGILWDTDPVSAHAFISGLRDAGYLVGDNEPYSGKAPQDFTIDHHAQSSGLPHVGIEIRQDLVLHDDGVARIADVMAPVIGSVTPQLREEAVAAQRMQRARA